MSPAQLVSHFDRISDAPDAISRLRRFILDLGVRGKLAEQDRMDEPASELLKRIRVEKERLVKAGKIRKANPFPRVEADEIPFASPAGWEWARIRQVTSDRGQAIPDKDFTYIDVTAINKEVGRIADAKVLSANDAPSRARKLVMTGDVLYSCVRPYLLNIAIIESDIVPSPIVSTAFAVLNGFGLVLSRYLWIVLRSPFMVECVEAKMRGQAYPAINDSDFSLLPLPLPPLAEQHRIVAKVDELMALCDRFETAKEERESQRDRLAAASLHRLNNGADPDAFRNHARFYFNHLPRLTARSQHIQQLRQTILNLAFRGRIVPQRLDEGTGAVLLKQIASYHSENQRPEGRRRKIQPLFDPLDCPGVFEIPENWAWTYLDFLCETIADVDHNMPKAVSDGVPFISAKDLKDDGTIDFTAPKMISENDYQRLSRKVQMRRDDIVYSRIGARLGKARLVNVNTRFLISYSCCLIRPLHEFIDKHYLQLFLDSTLALSQAHKGTQSIGVPDLGLGEIKAFKIPVPPLAEQHRIVAKVEELMALCGRLEAQLTITQTESRSLLEAVLNDALAGQSELEEGVLR